MGNGLFTQVTTQRKEPWVVPGVDIRKDFFTGRAVTDWAAVESPLLRVFKGAEVALKG